MATKFFRILLVVVGMVAAQAVAAVPLFAASIVATTTTSSTMTGELLLLLSAVAAVVTAPVFLTVREICVRLSICRATYYRLVAEGELPKPIPVRPRSRNVRGLSSDVDEYIARQASTVRPDEDVTEAAAR